MGYHSIVLDIACFVLAVACLAVVVIADIRLRRYMRDKGIR
jgi:hypothetical protein